MCAPHMLASLLILPHFWPVYPSHSLSLLVSYLIFVTILDDDDTADFNFDNKFIEAFWQLRHTSLPVFINCNFHHLPFSSLAVFITSLAVLITCRSHHLITCRSHHLPFSSLAILITFRYHHLPFSSLSVLITCRSHHLQLLIPSLAVLITCVFL